MIAVLALTAQAPAPRPQAKPAAPQPAPGARFRLQGPLVQGAAVLGTAPAGTTLLSFQGVAVPVAADGRFLIAFDRDFGPSAEISATLADGSVVRETLPVARRAWNIERLNSLPRFAQPAEEFNRLRPAELAQINAARAANAQSDGWRQPFLWPVIGRLSGLFGSQRIYKNGEAGSYHSGADIAQPAGTPVMAPADGVVVLAADHPFTLEGNLLMIDHGMGLNSAFLHLSRIDVAVGARVRRGQPVGAVGMTGRATGPHLHWSLRWRDAKIDPLLVAGPMPVAG
ncbi:M23 family metallopeptidase [Sphingomonas sp.]|uniref:M23 family metallopeptidase n=1 Tax=Sphingomonas sp. TaxID=28214 RepID=UPI0025FF768B|nr:M23 family metallopeptidase [Sphingomonas sp.]